MVYRLVNDKIMFDDFVFGIFPDVRIANCLLALLNKPIIGEIIALQPTIPADADLQHYAAQPHTEDNLKMLAALAIRALCK